MQDQIIDQLSVSPRALIFFVDETGDEKFSNPQHPVFGLAGCAIRMDAYKDMI